MLVMLLSVTVPLTSHALMEGDFTYEVHEGQATITSFNNEYSGSLTIPATLGGVPVSGIGNAAFLSCTSLTSVMIPDNITIIGEQAFRDCTSLTAINVDTNNPNYSSIEGVLFSKDKTSLFQYPNAKAVIYSIPKSVTSIGNYAFSDCSISNITIPENVTIIGFGAFDYCSFLTSVYFHGDAPQILGIYIFKSTPATVYRKEETSGWPQVGDSWAFRPTALWWPDFDYSIANDVVTITKYTGEGGAVTIPNTIEELPVTTIGELAFETCTSVTSVIIPDSVTSIGVAAFYYCTSMTSVTIGNSVISIGGWTFQECTSLTSITIPDSVASIGEEAFRLCSSMTIVTIGNGVNSIGERVFRNCTSLTAINVDASNSSYSSIEGVLFNNDQSYLIHYPQAKAGAYSVPESVATIGDRAFSLCQSLTSVIIPDSVTSIEAYAFYFCNKMLSLTIGNGVTNMGDYAFSACNSMTNLTIGNGVTILGNRAFSHCSSLTSVTIPASVTSIGEDAFFGCSSLARVYFSGNPPTTEGSIFSQFSANIYYLPGSIGWTSTYNGLPTALWNPTFTSTDLVSGNPSFIVTGTPGIPVTLETRTNLIFGEWSQLQTSNIPPSGTLEFIDTESVGHTIHFYRIVGQ